MEEVAGPSPDAGTARRRALVAVVLSGVFPGLGQLYNREIVKGVLFLLGGVLVGFGPWSPLDVEIDPGDVASGLRYALLASMPFLLIALWSVVDAYRVARRPPSGSTPQS